MQIELIETFLDLCDSRSFTATAERLGVTQSTVSGRITTLEGKLGGRLFRRGRAGTELTTEGLRFEPHARSLRLAWAEARRAVTETAPAALTLRLGIQPDLVGDRIGGWLSVAREALPEAAFYVEAGFSAQMCVEILAGELDVGILFTPTSHPDLHIETLGAVPYVLVSSDSGQLADIPTETYIQPDYSPAFLKLHADQLPQFDDALLSTGQSDLALGMVRALGGACYLPERTAGDLLKDGRFQIVDGAPGLSQPVFGAVHLKHRHRRPHKRVLRLMGEAL